MADDRPTDDRPADIPGLQPTSDTMSRSWEDMLWAIRADEARLAALDERIRQARENARGMVLVTPDGLCVKAHEHLPAGAALGDCWAINTGIGYNPDDDAVWAQKPGRLPLLHPGVSVVAHSLAIESALRITSGYELESFLKGCVGTPSRDPIMLRISQGVVDNHVLRNRWEVHISLDRNGNVRYSCMRR